MKGFVKSLTGVFLAGVTFFTLLTATGCSFNDTPSATFDDTTPNAGKYRLVSDAYIVVDDTLHKGDVNAYGTYYSGFGAVEFEFDCGVEMGASEYKYYKNNAPQEDAYEEKCEHCFGE